MRNGFLNVVSDDRLEEFFGAEDADMHVDKEEPSDPGDILGDYDYYQYEDEDRDV